VNPDEAKNLSTMIRTTLQESRQERLIEPEIRRLLDRVGRVQTRRMYVRIGTYGASLAAAAALFLLVLWPRMDKLKFTVGSDPGVENRWIQAESEIPVPLHFSDNSSIQLLPGTRARVASVTARVPTSTSRQGASKPKSRPAKRRTGRSPRAPTWSGWSEPSSTWSGTPKSSCSKSRSRMGP